ncbi:putative reverse transcriptase domain-containing protein [Tanacetum coccineum]
MERGFLSLEWSEGGREVKEKNGNILNKEAVKDGAIPSVTVAYGNTQEDNVGLSSTGPLASESGPDASFASLLKGTSKPIRKKLIFCTLFTPGGNGIDVVVLVESINAISERFVNTACGFFLGNSSTGLFSFQFSSIEGLNAMLENDLWFIRNNPLILKKWHPDVNLLKEDVGTPLMLDSYTSDMCMQSWGRSSYARAMIELRADVELRDNIVAAMPKITGEGYYTCNIRVEYEWKPPRCACCKVFGHTQEECPKDVGTGEIKNLKKTSQTPKGFPIDENVDPPKEVSKSNPFDVLTSVENDEELGKNGGTFSLASQATNSSGFSFWNVNASSPSTTPVIEKIDKIEKLIIEGKVTLVDDDGKPFEKVDSSCDYNSEDEVASVDSDMAKFLAKKDGYGTQSLLEQ